MVGVLGLIACGGSLDDLLDEVEVDKLGFDDDPADEVDPLTAVWELDVDADPELSFTAAGLFGIQQAGTWTRYDVRVAQGEGGPEAFEIRFVADMDSVYTGVTQLDEHLRTTDFLDVEAWPRATFDSTSVEPKGGDDYEVTGEMTLRGTTRTIRFEATIELGEGVRTTATIPFSRWDFGLIADDVDEPGGDGADDEVVVEYDVALRAAPLP